MINSNIELVYVTTPFCGICKGAKPVVDILGATLELKVIEWNANVYKSELKKMKITQVPSLFIRKQGNVLKVFDYIEDVTTMYKKIAPFLE